ncbi:SRPBCC domain-containing protein [Bradyrhizobium sp. U87765 SZCCT0131]|uniref:SRPBCC domain-containing protein n=1 Tax=unclassified Bradyrhizobium TaxID=2631580 RepID=UPI001BA9548C|nr:MULTISPECIES: SRPBCC domain-containing protein [unclassified Bradyrhizobium]MBR1216890.1 SRPBCC domain-containing protein [Bradyrhizobium sp. U87765 SZCCT0131]MBR1259354.1 SRPBCC domain-containing protein [Bradyrhizobium sp. U87765 SZCCT0134]MBR1305495.1 SRPBCC domain-containing protein [Bradyrhizobium sp. U87765 SZCCT0110]MBR1321862.1 SRPBCC domain-containing protein [Bradyrhizobium sp. U87765 SZCCT0109]MBR1350860.1 SRPBCC domain-containing protein [Bradyrhizobium sp. U87765 SZCCT0048]
MPDWHLNSRTEVVVAASAERLWTALTDADETEHYFMRARVMVGDVGGAFRLARDDGWHVDGTVLAKDAPHRLRVTWGRKNPPGIDMPDCEVEFTIAPAADEPSRSRLVVSEYVNGEMPPSLAAAGRTGWALMTRSLQAYLG